MNIQPTSSNPCVASTELKLFPWQVSAWQQINNSRRQHRLHHAYLIGGIKGLGKLQFTCNLAQSLLCNEPLTNGMPCNVCQSCHLFRIGNHPDLQCALPDPEKKSDDISIDTIRDLSAFDGLVARFGNYKILIITPAENLNRQAANSLLKTLEEPNSSTILFLIAAAPERLLPTIKSRCYRLNFTSPTEAEAVNWLGSQIKESSQTLTLALRLTQGAPLAALQLLQTNALQQRQDAITAFLSLVDKKANPLTVAETWYNKDLTNFLNWTSSFIADLLRLQTKAINVRLENPDLTDVLRRYANSFNEIQLHHLWSKIMTAQKQLQQSNVNPQLLLETILIHWSELAL
jgi:DNA polymerase-3 subunit delta'